MLATLVSIFSLMLSTLLMMVAFGLQSYVVPVRAVAEGWSTQTISMIATGYTIGFTLSCIITPKFVLLVGHVRVFVALITLLAIANNRPRVLNLLQIIEAFVEFRQEVIRRRI